MFRPYRPDPYMLLSSAQDNAARLEEYLEEARDEIARLEDRETELEELIVDMFEAMRLIAMGEVTYSSASLVAAIKQRMRESHIPEDLPSVPARTEVV